MARGRGNGRGAARGRGRPPGRGRGRGRGRELAVSSSSSEETTGAAAEGVASAAQPAAEAQAASAAIIQNLQRENQELRRQVQAALPAAAALVTEPAAIAIPPEARMSLREWMSLRVDTFDGAGTPVQAADWLRYMERQFGALEMTSAQKAWFVAFQLKGQADIWWEGVLSARTQCRDQSLGRYSWSSSGQNSIRIPLLRGWSSHC